MAVYEHRYQRYPGPLTPERFRFLVIPKYAVREIFSSKLFLSFYVLCFLAPLIAGLVVWVLNNATFLEFFRLLFRTTEDLRPPLNGSFFFWLSAIQGCFALLLTMVMAPALVAQDLRNNALPLFLSRPLSRFEYVAGKVSVLLMLLSTVTWVPIGLIFLLQGSQAEGWFGEYRWISGSILLSSGLWISFLCLAGLAVSAMVRWKPIARLTLFGLFFVTWSVAKMVNALPGVQMQTPWSDLLSPISSLMAVWQPMFRQTVGTALPGWAGLGSLAAMALFFTLMLARKVRAYEVVK